MPVGTRNAWPVAIAGGGIGGLACALALARQGFRSLVLEQAPEFGEVGVGLQVAPNALSVLDALGVGAAAKKHALLIERLLMLDAVTGDEVANIPLRRAIPASASAILTRCASRRYPRRAARRLPRARADRASQRLPGAGLRDVGQRRRGHRWKAASGSRPRRWSAPTACIPTSARRIVGDGDPPPAGAVIYRATIPAADMPKDLQQPYPTFWAGPGWHVIYYPMRDWSTFNLGCTVVTSQTPPNDGEDVSPHYVLPLFAGSCAAPLRVLRMPKQFRRYVIRHREPVENWTDGAVTLLGDAAHPMVQYIAQGAAMALEDAICLAGLRGRDATAISPGRSSATRTSASCAPRGCRSRR